MNTAEYMTVCLACIVLVSAYSNNPPRQPIEVKLKHKQHLLQHYIQSDPVDTEEMDDVEGADLFFGSDAPAWDELPNDTATDYVWLPFNEPSENATETITLITDQNHTNTFVQDIIETLGNFFSESNSTTDFIFITHIQLPPHSCPFDVARHFEKALQTVNPGTTISSKAIRSGSVVCNPECPCASQTRHLATKTLEIRTTSSASTVRMPSNRHFPIAYDVMSSI